jgi:hypothetical protein
MVQGALPSTALPSIGYAISASQGGKMSLPVAPGSYIYSHFKHVTGVPAPDGVQGVTINKLKILDVLIEQLSQAKQRPRMDFNAASGSDEQRIDALIEQYETKIRQVQAASSAMPYAPQPSAPAGVLFNLVA